MAATTIKIRPTKAEYERSQISRKKISSKPKALELRHAIAAIRNERSEAKRWRDPLVLARNSRPYRTPSAISEQEARQAARRAEIEGQRAREIAAQEQAEASRKALIAAAREARKLGFQVRSSKGRDGRISSYYAARFDKAAGHTVKIRISDHELPWTPKRDFMAREHGRDYFDGHHGLELIVGQPRRAEWLRRAIILTAAGRM